MNPAARPFSRRLPERRAQLNCVPALRTFASLMILSAAACRRDGAALGGTGGDARSTGGAGGLDAGIGGAGGVAGADAAGEVGIDADAGGGSVDAGALMALKVAAAQAGRLIGVALGASHLSEPVYAATAAAAFSFATPENEMKRDATEPTQNVFTFGGGDAITAFAQQNGMRVKGHTLVWHSQLPDWVSGITDPTALHDAMINHVTQVVSHYRGQVIAWDVVNEAVDDDGLSLRDSIFYQYLGAGYIDDAYNAARAADPGAILLYNDYGAEGAGAKSDYVYSMVQGMLRVASPSTASDFRCTPDLPIPRLRLPW